MRVVDLKPFEILTIPKDQAELMRSLAGLTEQIGADRFAYMQLPIPFDLMNVGVKPRTLTNYPDYILSEYLRSAKRPFNMAVRALTSRKPVFFSDALAPEEVLFRRISAEYGYRDGVIIPIADADDAVFCFAFRRPISRDWVEENFERSMNCLAMLVHMGIQGRKSLCPPFQVPGFTERVREVLALKTKGLTNEEVATALGVKPDTIKKTIRRFSERLGGLSTTELVYHMAKLGML